MTRVARAVEKGETRGFLKIYVEEGTKRILGAALLGTSADESVHSLIDAVYANFIHRVSEARAHPPERERAAANGPRGPPTAGMTHLAESRSEQR